MESEGVCLNCFKEDELWGNGICDTCMAEGWDETWMEEEYDD